MNLYLHVLLRVLAGITGVLSLYAAFFLYQDEEARLQNRLEQLWNRIDALQSAAMSAEVAFLQGATRTTTTILDRLLGHRLISLQSITVSMACSQASTFAWGASFYPMTVIQFDTKLGIPYGVDQMDPLMLRVCAVALLILGGLAAIGTEDSVLIPFFRLRWRKRNYLWVLFLLVLCLPLAVSVSTGIIINHNDVEDLYGVLTLSAEIGALVVAGAIFDISFIALFRWALRKLIGVRSLVTILWRLLVFAVIAAVLIFPALILSLPDISSTFFPSGINPNDANSVWTDLALALCYLSTTNLIDALCLLLLVMVMLLLLVHRLLWPMIKRPLYSANRRQLIKNTKLLMVLGVVSITYAFPHNLILRSVVDFVAKIKA